MAGGALISREPGNPERGSQVHGIHTPMRRLTLTSLVLSVLAITGLGACKSGVGEHCQVTADCEDGLVCGALTSTCQEDIESTSDAAVDAPQDGPDIDAAPAPDAAVDAAVDAPPDA